MPATIYLCHRAGGRVYYLASVLIILYTMIPFFLVFEHRKPQAKELVVLAVLCAIAVASRAAFRMIDHFKPMTAIVMIAGVAFGPEAGFLVGGRSAGLPAIFSSATALDPWQMFAFGTAGFLAGALYRAGVLEQKGPLLSLFGFFTVLLFGRPTAGHLRPLYPDDSDPLGSGEGDLSVRATGQLHPRGGDLSHPLFFSRPLLEKLDRVRLKYWMMEGQPWGLNAAIRR